MRVPASNPASLVLLLGTSLTQLARGDHGVVYAERCDPYGSSSHYEETMDIKRRVRIIKANSCPSHFNVCQKSECAENTTYAIQHEVEIEIPLYPGMSRDDHIQSLRCKSGSVAIALNGVSIQSLSEGYELCGTPEQYGEQNGLGSQCNLNGINDGTKYCGDQVATYSSEFDKCGGHADKATGIYHYHTAPSCLLDKLKETNDIGAHSAQLGWAFDGFPVYGPLGPQGVEMVSCEHVSHTPGMCLDSCNGYYGRLPGIDEYMYRYYITGPVSSGKCSDTVLENGAEKACDREDEKCCPNTVPDRSYAPYTLGCHRGCAYNDPTCLLSNDLVGTTDLFYPSLSRFELAVYGGSSGGGPNIDTDIEESTSETTEEATDDSDPTPLEETEPTTLTSSVNRAVLHRVLSPHRAFSISSTTSDGDTAVLQLKGDVRDTVVVGAIALHAKSSRVYYTTESSVAWVADDGTREGQDVISGITDIKITGYNFGSELSSVKSITVQGQACSSIQFIASTELRCRLKGQFTKEKVLPATALAEIDGILSPIGTISLLRPSDVQVVCTTGSMTGIHDQPETISRGSSGRLVVSAIEFNHIPLLPYAIAVSTSALASNNELDSVYWSDIGEANGVYRSLMDGTQIQNVLIGAPRVNGMFLLERSTGGVSCRDLLTCDVQQRSKDETLFPFPESQYDGLFYADADRRYADEELRSVDGRGSVVGLIPVLRDGTELRDEPIAASTMYATSSENIVFGQCSSSSRGQDLFAIKEGMEFVLMKDNSGGREISLVSGINDPRSVSVDPSTGSMLVTSGDGIIWKINILKALQYYKAMWDVTDLISCCAVVTEGGVQSCARAVVDVRRYSKLSPSPTSIPPWLEVLFMSTKTLSRFTGVSIIPSSAFTTKSLLQTERRVFALDINMNRLWLLDIFGSNYRYVDLQQTLFGASRAIFLPNAISVRNTTDNSVEIFIGEYLGKIWRVAVTLESLLQPSLMNSSPPVSISGVLNNVVNTQGARQSALDTAPMLVLDQSQFHASYTTRKVQGGIFLAASS